MCAQADQESPLLRHAQRVLYRDERRSARAPAGDLVVPSHLTNPYIYDKVFKIVTNAHINMKRKECATQMDRDNDTSVDVRRWVFKALLFIYDAFIVNFAFFMAIIIRFYIEYRWHDMGAQYIEMFWRFAPYYTAFSLVTFLLFRLYRGVWRYVGIHDIQKLILANALTCVFQVIGGLLIVGRMPITYYVIGACLQFALMSIPRIAPRFILESFGATGAGGRQTDLDIPMMIIGAGENARIIQNKLKRDKTNIARPVCVLDYEKKYSGGTFNGLPVVSGSKGIQDAIKKYDIKCAIIADDTIPENTTGHIREICDKNGIELRNFTMRAVTHDAGMRLKDLLETIQGPVQIREVDAQEAKQYPTGVAALEHYRYNYTVETITAAADELCISVRPIGMPHIQTDEEWIKKYREENGGEVSFFV